MEIPSRDDTARRTEIALASDREHVRLLDGIRGIAALEVVGGHARWLLWAGFGAYLERHGHNPSIGLMAALASFAFRYGHQSVILFFLVSGFAIHFREAKRLATGHSNGRLDLAQFARRRFRRLFPPLGFAVLLTALFDWAGRRVNSTSITG